jgi:DNA-directed RNA polymerase subunit RPC12/RpoP
MCPRCQSKDLRASHPTWRDFLARLMKARPVRCRHCDHRSYEWPWLRDLTTGKLVRR